jgi:hypothetical protein
MYSERYNKYDLELFYMMNDNKKKINQNKMNMLKYKLDYYDEDTYKPMRNPDILYQFCKDNDIFTDYYFYRQSNNKLYFKSKRYLDFLIKQIERKFVFK